MGLNEFFSGLRTAVAVVELMTQVDRAIERLPHLRHMTSEHGVFHCLYSLNVFHKELRWKLGDITKGWESAQGSWCIADLGVGPKFEHQDKGITLDPHTGSDTWTEQERVASANSTSKLHSPSYRFDFDGMTLALRGWSWAGQISESFDGFLLDYRAISSTSLMYVPDSSQPSHSQA